MTKEQELFLGIGENIRDIFGRDLHSDQYYRKIMEGCFTQRALLMAEGIERLASSFSMTIPLFLRGRLLQAARALRKDDLATALWHSTKAREYNSSLSVSKYRPTG